MTNSDYIDEKEDGEEEEKEFRLSSRISPTEPNSYEEIETLRGKMKDLGEYGGRPVDHYEGSLMDAPLRSGVENFQKKKGLEVDGLILPGGETERAINKELQARRKNPSLMNGERVVNEVKGRDPFLMKKVGPAELERFKVWAAPLLGNGSKGAGVRNVFGIEKEAGKQLTPSDRPSERMDEVSSTNSIMEPIQKTVLGNDQKNKKKCEMGFFKTAFKPNTPYDKKLAELATIVEYYMMKSGGQYNGAAGLKKWYCEETSPAVYNGEILKKKKAIQRTTGVNNQRFLQGYSEIEEEEDEKKKEEEQEKAPIDRSFRVRVNGSTERLKLSDIPDGETVEIADKWDRLDNFYPGNKERWKFHPRTFDMDYGLGIGGYKIRSGMTGKATRKGNQVSIEGNIDHRLEDEYQFDEGQWQHKYGYAPQVLLTKKYGKKSYPIISTPWYERLSGDVTFDDEGVVIKNNLKITK